MDCRHFRKLHALFLDDTLSGVETWSMRDHLAACEACARLDTQVRRALMVARSAPMLEPSPAFRRRLSSRLAVERLARSIPGERSQRRPAMPMVVAAVGLLAAGLGLTGALAALRPSAAQDLVLAPIVVTPPTLPSEPVAAPAMFATVSSSLPVYTAMLLARRATEQFAATHARTVSFQAAH